MKVKPPTGRRRYEFDARAWALKNVAQTLEDPTRTFISLEGLSLEDARAAERALLHIIKEMKREASIRDHTRGARGTITMDVVGSPGELPDHFDTGGQIK